MALILKGPKGPKGDRGVPGPQGPKGSKGDKGTDGLSAYELWLKQGNEGTIEDFFEDLKGIDGRTPKEGIDYWVPIPMCGADGKDGTDGLIIDDGGDGSPLEDATFTYNGDLITRIDYEGGQSKVFTYNGDDTINTLVWDRLDDTVTKTFGYTNGKITSVTVEIV